MRRIAVGTVLALAILALVSPAASGRTYEIDYATYDVVVTDSKGVKTEAWDFGFYAGPNILTATRGDGYVEIPFRKIRSIEFGKYIPAKGYSPCTVTSLSNRTYSVGLERIEGRRFLGGESDLGSFRIRLGQIKRLDILRMTPEEDLE